MPITFYREDPEKGEVTEWHQVTAAQDAGGFWYLLEHHGWWDRANRKPHADVPILRESHKTEASMLAAMNDRFSTLKAEGWIYKFTTTFDPARGFVPVRIP